MKLSLEISMYPLNKDYKTIILDFIKRLNRHEGITIITNNMSTQVSGEFDVVMGAYTTELKASFEKQEEIMVVSKFFNADLLNG